MPGLVSFADFISATRDVKITSKQELLNEATKRSYFLKWMLRGQGVADVFRGGKQLTERIQANDNGSFRFYNPGDEFNPTGVDTLVSVAIDWRFAMTNFVFYDEETELNSGDEDAYIDLKKSYEQAAMTSNFNGMENALWAVPNAATMETNGSSGTPMQSFSLPCFNNEFTNGLPSGFTTLMTLDPTASPFWVPNQSGYNSADISALTKGTTASATTASSTTTTSPVSDGLLSAMEDMWLSMKFDKLVSAQEYFENDDLKKMKIATNKDGHKTFSLILKSLNNRLTPNANDPAYPDPLFNGYPIEYVESLDTAPIYSGATVSASQSGGVAATGYPRFHWYNLRYIYPVFHTQRYLYPILKDGGAKAPTANVMYYNTWYNLVCRSRRRGCGTVYPSA